MRSRDADDGDLVSTGGHLPHDRRRAEPRSSQCDGDGVPGRAVDARPARAAADRLPGLDEAGGWSARAAALAVVRLRAGPGGRAGRLRLPARLAAIPSLDRA